MAKRRLSHQQKRRIHHAQTSLDVSDADLFRGLVIAHHGGEVEIEPEEPQSDDRQNLQCSLRANIGNLVCGDRVLYRLETPTPAVVSVLPRDNLLQRLDGFGNLKAVAANVSQLLICLAVEPEPNLFLLDQYLLSAEQQAIQAAIVLNKTDLLRDEDSDPFDLQRIYQTIGYDILYTSVTEMRNIDRLQQHCIGQVNVISGVSGVGKSSLTKAILPELDIRIREISRANLEGRHTTRTSRLYHLPLGGDLIDTPGVRGFRPAPDSEASIASGFREIARQSEQCRFHNCRHINEPGCTVLQAVEQQQIAESRYLNYLKLLQETAESR